MWDFKREILRKLVHIFISLMAILLVLLFSNYYGKENALLVLAFFLIVILLSEYSRVELRKNIPFADYFFRQKERKRFGGQVFFLIGGIIVYAVFDLNIAIAAVLMTTFGDLASCLVGCKLGKIWITKSRNLEGILAEFVVDLAVASFIIGNFWIILSMALAATLIETLVHELDDNLYVPLFAGFAGQLAKLIIS